MTPQLDAFTRESAGIFRTLIALTWTGFWDRGYDLEAADRLTKAAHAYGEAYVCGPETTDQGGVEDAAFDAWDGVISIEE